MNLNDYIRSAQERIEDLIRETNGKCYIAFSGGKDSTIILALVKMCYELGTIQELPKAVYSDTGIEYQAIKDFVIWCKDSDWYSNIEIIHPKKSFSQCCKEYGKPIISKAKSDFISTYQKNNCSYDKLKILLNGITNTGKQTTKYILSSKNFNIINPEFDIKISNKCCKTLKKDPFQDYAIDNDIYGYINGMRMAEGGIRASNIEKRVKNGGKICTSIKYISKLKRNIISKSPIVDWTDEIEEEFIKKYNIPLSKAYIEYKCDRTGCVLCPFAKCNKDVAKRLKILYDFEPVKYKLAMATMKDIYIAQNIELDFDKKYEEERLNKWEKEYSLMRYEMLKKHREEKADKYKPDYKIRLF